MGTPQFGRTPRVFVSSTIADLRDLRSAVKYFLEDVGFDVILSEFPTFPHALDESARLAAIPAIEDCDYFLLIIGERYGTVLADGASVTRAEYRRARQLAAEGRLKLLPFARESVFDFWRHKVESVPDLPDWPAIRSFLAEVNEEQPNVSNWIHRFSSFRDVTDILRAQLSLSGPLRRRALEANLLWELRANIRACHWASEKHPPMAVSGFLTPEILPEPGDFVGDAPLHLTNSQAEALVWVWLYTPSGARGLRSAALRDAIASGEFLDYHVASASFRVGKLQATLLDLADRIAQLRLVTEGRSAADDWTNRHIQNLVVAARRGATGGVEIPAMVVRMIYVMRNQVQNILALSVVVARLLRNIDETLADAVLVPLFPPSPPMGKPGHDRDMTDGEVEEVINSGAITGLPAQGKPTP